MAYRLRTWTKRFFILSNWVAAVIFLLACGAAYCNPYRFWLIALLGVGFLFITVIMLGFFVFWLLVRSRWAWLSLATLLIGWFQIHSLFGIHAFTQFQQQKQAGTFRVLTWNVSRWDEMNKQAKGGTSYRLKMFDFIKSQDADILCIQEFFESCKPELFDENIPYITRVLGYPYHYVAIDHVTWNGIYKHGIALFSRYPIVDTFRLRYPPGSDPLRATESLIRATINVNGKKINVFTTHLQSFLFTGNDYRNLRTIKQADDKDSVLKAGKGIVKKFRTSYKYRSIQADIVREKLDSSHYPEIICGDFNDVPNSYTYFTIKGNRQDAFIESGFGLGRTYVFISPTLRIDYILADPAFQVMQCKKAKLPYSDHFPVIADFQLP
ncbi:MAG: endonuclease/exonuclease/phosphatase family protein [Williamsia sp.]|nr:endonuclease/exonuclease/phosphatase family protein [Williamsia sp.]